MGEKKSAKAEKFTAEQGKSKVGYKQPPEEHQFKPGESGNPKGPPVRRTNLWVWFCKYMEMTDTELKKLKLKELTQAQRSALKLVKNMKNGQGSGSQRLALSVFDREEGKAVEHLVIEDANELTDGECEEIRDILLKNHADK